MVTCHHHIMLNLHYVMLYCCYVREDFYYEAHLERVFTSGHVIFKLTYYLPLMSTTVFVCFASNSSLQSKTTYKACHTVADIDRW